MPLIRYPGSKGKLISQLWNLFPDEITEPLWSRVSRIEYREPFFGSGAIGFKVFERLDRRCCVWVNDIDQDLICLWRAVQQTPKPLCRLITDFKPSVDKFYEYKERDGVDDCSPVERGFRKLALHRMSVSGFGVKSGGPIGGRSQSSEYPVDCRWTPSRMKSDVMKLNALVRRFQSCEFTSVDFQQLITDAPDHAFIYLDPPYYEKGSQLYKFPMTMADHARLRDSLSNTAAQWVLSYDDHPVIRNMYSSCSFCELRVTYSNAVCRTAKRPKNNEIAITPCGYKQEIESQ